MSTNIADAVPRLKRLVPRLRGKRIGVLGDLMLDRYLWGTASRLSPEAAVSVVDFVEQSEWLGGAGDVAAHIARSEEHTSELQSHLNLRCPLLLVKKKINT